MAWSILVLGAQILSLESIMSGATVMRFLAKVNSGSRSLLAVARLSVCLSVTLVHPIQVVEIFHNISTAFGTLTIR